jgi:small subunit ribosomal protein S9
MINGKVVAEYVTRSDLFDVLYSAIRLTKLKDKVYFDVKVTGS